MSNDWLFAVPFTLVISALNGWIAWREASRVCSARNDMRRFRDDIVASNDRLLAQLGANTSAIVSIGTQPSFGREVGKA